MTALILRLEWSAVRAAARRAMLHPTRRMLWSAVVTIVLVAVAIEIATSGSGSRNLGSWAPSALTILAAGAGVVVIAALAGRRTSLTYGTRVADATWWRYAGVDTDAGQRATTAVLAVRTTALATAVAAPLGALFAATDSRYAGTIAMMSLAAIVVSPLAVLASSAAARRSDTVRMSPSVLHAEASSVAASPIDGATVSTAHAGVSATGVPRGLIAARWLVARRRGEPVVPLMQLVSGLVLGFVLPWVAARAGGQMTALAVVVGGFALLLDGALRRTTAPATLLTPWWRAAIGTSALAIVVWALADASAVAAFTAGVSLALGIALRAPLPGVAAVPLVVLVPVGLRSIALAVDTVLPGDRRGPGAFVRVAAVGILTALVAVAAFAAGARGGAAASLAAATVLLVALIVPSAVMCSKRLAAV